MSTLLIIDDVLADRARIAGELTRTMLDVEIFEAADAETGLALVDQERPQCVLLARDLPDRDGLSVLCELREREGGHGGPPVILLTRDDDESLAMEALGIGAEDVLNKNTLSAATLFRAARNAVEAASLRQQLADAQRLLRQLALHDALTGLGNRNLFEDQFALFHAASQRDGRPFMVMLIDLDKFKPINDTLGHEAGDMVLMTVAARLSRECGDGDVFFRMGGDEFLGLVQSNVSRGSAAEMAERIGAAILEPMSVDGATLHVGCSIGIAIHPEDGHDKETLIRHADHAMYAAKRACQGFAFHAAPESV